MKPFVRVEGAAAPLELSNVDTDRIVPARYLGRSRTEGYGDCLFRDLRFDAGGGEAAGFVLNEPAYRHAVVLVAAENFGGGSSREAAVWALADYGIRAVFASSFGDIFFENSFKNGLLAVRLPPAELARLRGAARERPGGACVVDLPSQTVTAPDGATIAFDIDPFRKECLIAGRDEIDLTMTYGADIEAFEQRHRAAMPWLF